MSEETACANIEFHPQIKKVFIEFFLYALFLLTTCVVAFGNVGTSSYFCTDMISKSLVEKTFRTNIETEMSFMRISSISEFWQFTQTVLVEAFFEADIDQSNKFTRFLTENILIGSVRIRQLRVKKGSCSVHPLFTPLFSDCFDFFSSSSEDKGSFGLKVGLPWTYHSSEKLEGFPTWGKFQFYPGGGFYQDLGNDREQAERNLRSFYKNGWIDRGTRVVFIEFTIYNPNINIFCSSKLIIEVLPTGGLIPTTHYRDLKLLKFMDFSDIVLITFEVAFIVQILVYTWMEIHQMTKLRRYYFFNLWNILDLLIILISYFAIGFSIFRIRFIDDKIMKYKDTPKKYISFDVIVFWQRMFLDSIGVCVGLVWIRMLKYVKFSSTMLQFGKTLERCAGDIAGFGLMFFIVFLAYAQLGFILFGSEIRDFHTVFDAVFTLMRTILGDFDYLAIEKANRVLGPIFFLSYIFFVFFVLLNMFLAIINDSYEEVKSEGAKAVLPINEFITKKLKFWHKRAQFKLNKSSVKSQNWSDGVIESANDNIDDDITSIRNNDVIFADGIGDEVDEKCTSCIDNNEKLDRMNERIFALENAVDHCVLKFNEVVNKLKVFE